MMLPLMSFIACSKVAETVAQQPSTSHMTIAKIFPHITHHNIPNNQSISSLTPPSPAPQSDCMLNYSMCSVVPLLVSVSASPPADCQTLLPFLGGSEAENTHLLTLCGYESC